MRINLKARRIAVIGGAGFIGSHLVDKVVALGKQVTVFDNFSTGSRTNLVAHEDNSNVQIIEGDVRDPKALNQALCGVDYVFHLATHCVRRSLTDPQTNHDVNSTGTLNVLQAAKAAAVKRFIYCSSSEVYGNAATGLLDENSAKKPTTIYGATKLAGEHYTLAFHQTYGLSAMVVRPFNTYGPRAHLFGPYGEVVPRFAILLRAGRQPVIFGDGHQTRDFTYVEDTAEALIGAASCDKLLGDTINLAKGTEVSISDLAETICRVGGYKLKPRHIECRPGDIQSLAACTAKAKRLNLKMPSTTLEDGIKRYLDWLDIQSLDYPVLAGFITEKNWLEIDNGIVNWENLPWRAAA